MPALRRPGANQALAQLLQLPRDKCDLRGQKPAARMSAVKSASGAVKSVPGVATLIMATSTGGVGCLRIHRPGKMPDSGDVPNPDSEAGHGQTVSVEDPHRQPHAASRNVDAELRLRSATVRR